MESGLEKKGIGDERCAAAGAGAGAADGAEGRRAEIVGKNGTYTRYLRRDPGDTKDVGAGSFVITSLLSLPVHQCRPPRRRRRLTICDIICRANANRVRIALHLRKDSEKTTGQRPRAEFEHPVGRLINASFGYKTGGNLHRTNAAF